MKQAHRILEAGSVDQLLEMEKDCASRLDGYEIAFKRYFLADCRQADELPPADGAVSVICQPPLSGAKVAVWLWFVSDASIIRSKNCTFTVENGEKHLWTAGIRADGADSEAQMEGIFRLHGEIINSYGMELASNCVRTWIHVDDIDNNYSGVVKGRRTHFDGAGLTRGTHYIASTGIQGAPCNEGGIVQMDSYSVKSEDLHLQYLYAPTHLNPTYEYGVTFERGVRMSFRNSCATFISGTASIDNKGAVVHVGDIVRQTQRMWENVEKLLEEAGKRWEDVSQMIVYLRNASDYSTVAPMFNEKFPGKPFVILLAPVCRPEWLIEMECIAD